MIIQGSHSRTIHHGDRLMASHVSSPNTTHGKPWLIRTPRYGMCMPETSSLRKFLNLEIIGENINVLSIFR